MRRSRFVAALSDTIFVVHAAVGSKTEGNLLDLGAAVGNVEQIVGMRAVATGRRTGRR